MADFSDRTSAHRERRSTRLTYLLVPLVSIAAFAAYSSWSKTQRSESPPAVVKPTDAYEGRDGRKEAEAAFGAGKLVLIESGTPVSWEAERREIALRKFGIELRSRQSETSSAASAKYADAFNRFMRPRIIARHGRGVFDAIHHEAIALMESRRAQQPAAQTPSATPSN